MSVSSAPSARSLLSGNSFAARAMRGTTWTAFGYVAVQAIRFGSNLVLTRLLFPEAFGLMALVMVVLVGMTAFSDAGTTPAIMQNRRGDDPAFLDTVWTIQIIRGLALWLVAWLLGAPLAAFYGEPLLASLLPVAGLVFVIMGFYPTKVQTANRHLLLGRVTVIEIVSYSVSVALLISLAWLTGSVWALVAGNLTDAVLKLVLMSALLPGPGNRLGWDGGAAREVLRFGAWVLPSTACSFLLAQGDRLILGKYLPLDLLGVYNIGYFLASFPVLFATAITTRILIPVYREVLPGSDPNMVHRLHRMRLFLTGIFLSGLVVMAFLGPALVDLLYDPRYSRAGAVVVLLACVQLPHTIGMTYDQAALAAGESRRYFNLLLVRAGLFLACFLVGIETAGLFGALVGQGVASLVIYPLTVRMARHYRTWDARHDLGYFTVAAVTAAAALSFHWSDVRSLTLSG